jgi:hypothetical protein
MVVALVIVLNIPIKYLYGNCLARDAEMKESGRKEEREAHALRLLDLVLYLVLHSFVCTCERYEYNFLSSEMKLSYFFYTFVSNYGNNTLGSVV